MHQLKKAYFSFFIIFLLVAGPYAFHGIINTPYVKNKIAFLIYQKTGLSVDASQIALKFLPEPEIVLKNTRFRLEKRIGLDIQRLKFDLGVQSLLQGRIDITGILIESPRILFLSVGPEESEEQGQFHVSKINETLTKILAILPEHQKHVELVVRNASSPYFKHMDGSISLSGETGEILFNASIKELGSKMSDLSRTSPGTYPGLDSIESEQLTLTLKINSDADIQGQLKSRNLVLRSENNDPVMDAGTIHAFFSVSNTACEIEINPFQINSSLGMVSIRFFSDLVQKTSEIKFMGNNIHIDQARKVSLAIFKDNAVADAIYDILHGGISPEITVFFQTDEHRFLFDEKNLALKGTLAKGIVKIPGTDLIASDVEGSAEIHRGILDIKANHAMIKTSALEQGHLRVDLLNSQNFPFNGNFTLKVDLSMVPETLIALLPDTLLAKELARVHNAAGQAVVRLNLALGSSSNDIDVGIDSDDFSVKGAYNRVPGHIFLERINFKYESDVMNLSNVKGMINGIDIYDLNTRLDFKQEPTILIQSGSGRISLDSVIPWMMSHKKTEKILSPVKTGSGNLGIASINLSGPVLLPGKWRYKIIGTGENISLATAYSQKEIETLACRYRISEGDFFLENMNAKIENLSWVEPFIEKKHLESIRTPLNMENGNLHITPQQSFFMADLHFPDGQKLEIEAVGEKPESLVLKKVTVLDPGFSDAVMTINHDSEKKTVDFKGILNTRTLHGIILPESFPAEKINGFTEGKPVLIHTDMDSTINIITEKLNLNSFFSQQPLFAIKNRPFLNNSIKFKTNELNILNLTITDLDTEIFFKNNASHIRLNTALLCDLDIKGIIHLEKDRIHAEIPFKAEEKENIQDLLTCLLKKNDLMDGRYSLNGKILSDASKTDFLNTLTGSLSFRAEKGRVYKLTLLSRILSVLNVSRFLKGRIPDITQEGFAYKAIFIEADINNSIIHISKAVINGNDMTIVFTGTVDFIKDHMDLTCLVAPFKTADLIIEKIPIINTMLGGNLVSVPVKAFGKISDPAVIPLHPSAVGEGLVSMMTNILETPIKLLDKISDLDKIPDNENPQK